MADIEQKVAGRWSMIGDNGKPFVFHLFQDGRYYTTCEGHHVESGTMSASAGKWQLKSDAGRQDNGSFTVTDGDLVLDSAINRTTKWKRFNGTEPAAATPGAPGGVAGVGTIPGAGGIPGAGAIPGAGLIPGGVPGAAQSSATGTSNKAVPDNIKRMKNRGFSTTYGGYNEYGSRKFFGRHH
ncbi:MAG: hypothetical protein KC777_04565 [Cyanobacteria bacterium HKST-UBA02]|nr:hypothetical protein [Cyanobacteria bacterium HKST-UBA02]